MRTLIRARQRVVTALFPHNANSHFLIPPRGSDIEFQGLRSRFFGAGQDGFLWDSRRRGGIWQDHAGTIPAVVAGVVGRVDDTSGNGHTVLSIDDTAATKPSLLQDGVNYRLQFNVGAADGQGMLSAAFAAQPVGKVVHVIAVNRLANTVPQTVSTYSTNTGSNGSLYVRSPNGAGQNQVWSRSKGTINADAAEASATVNNTPFVITTISDIAGDSHVLRVNGVERATAMGDQGTGGYLAHPFRLAHWNNSTINIDFFEGQIGATLLAFGTYSLADIQYAERWAAARMGVVLE